MYDYGLGRRFAPDPRDNKYRMSAAPRMIEGEKTYNYWNDSIWFLDQGPQPHCVEYSLHHYMLDSPHTHGGPPLWQWGELYRQAQLVDEWEGEDYEGTSVRAGAKVLLDWGYLEQYLWAWDIDSIINAVLYSGPVIVGTNWYSGMYNTDSKGYIHASGRLMGGHAYDINGVNTKSEFFRIKNSWSRVWGNNGRAKISFTDMERLINEYGEALLAVESKVI